MIINIGQDKWKHAAIEAAITAAVKCVLLWLIGWPVWAACATAAAVGGIAGVCKEMYDRRHDGTADWHDLAADAVGIIIGVL
ncbi:MAG: hypothetical protein K6E73_10725 [Bacteroidales bacterium]|nr:hypothetical protein [Bacteroidales bacterium]